MMATTVLGCCLCCRHLVVVIACHCPLPCICPICAIDIALALAALANALISAHHPCCHHHCPLCCCRRCSPTTLVTIAIALLPSPSLLHATLIVIAIALIVTFMPLLSLARHPCCHCHHSCHHCHPHCCCLPTLLPLHLPSSSPLPSLACHPCCHCAIREGGGGPYQSGA